MLRPVVFANAVAAVSAIGSVACALLSLAAPGLLLSIAQGWAHTLDLTKIQRPGFTLGEALLGLVTFTIFMWIGGWLLATIYNRWSGATSTASTPPGGLRL
ncbi:MAG: DUF5676 family membrane protein [Dehalococcoidia bacterium]|nr:DUF5676 family membrane protein [Dehalococcoidia bacterium]